MFLQEAVRDNQLPCLFHLIEAAYIPAFIDPSSIFKAHHFNLWFYCHLFLLTLSHYTSLLWEPGWLHLARPYNPGQCMHFKILKLISSGKSPMPYKALRISTGKPSRGSVQPTTIFVWWLSTYKSNNDTNDSNESLLNISLDYQFSMLGLWQD